MKNKKMHMHTEKLSVMKILRRSYFWCFILIIIVGIAIRFFQIEHMVALTCDQARDAFKVTSLLQGNILLDGPRTGVGSFYLGPLYFYLLTPFFFFTHLDPIASQYFNMVLNIFAFGIIFYTTKKLFSAPLALLVIGMYAVSSYIIESNRIPWNVSLVPSLSFLIFYFTYKTFEEKKYIWSVLLMTFCGMFFHAHFTAVIFPIAIFILWLFSDKKLKILRLLLLSLPFYIVWFIPTIIDYSLAHKSPTVVNDFFKYYFVGFHLQFVLHRLSDVLIQFRSVLSIPSPMEYIFVLGLGISYFLSERKLYIKIIFSWLIATLLVFGIYGGPVSDYYFLFTMPAVFYCLLVLLEVVLRFSKPAALTALILFLFYYGFFNLNNIMQQKPSDSLAKQKASVRQMIREGKVITYNECDFNSFLYFLYTDKL